MGSKVESVPKTSMSVTNTRVTLTALVSTLQEHSDVTAKKDTPNPVPPHARVGAILCFDDYEGDDDDDGDDDNCDVDGDGNIDYIGY